MAARHGGRYVMDKKTGKPKRVGGTKDHPDGNRARNKDGSPINQPAPAAKEKPQPVKKAALGK